MHTFPFSRVTRTLAAVLWLAAGPALAQDARLVVRAALIPTSATFAEELADLERAELPARGPYDTDPRPVFLGDTLLALGPGSVASVALDIDEGAREPVVALALAPRATAAFGALTVERLGETLALVLDGRVLTAPYVVMPVPSGYLQITGVGGVGDAEALARSIADATGAETTPD